MKASSLSVEALLKQRVCGSHSAGNDVTSYVGRKYALKPNPLNNDGCGEGRGQKWKTVRSFLATFSAVDLYSEAP